MITTPKDKPHANEGLTTEFYQYFWHGTTDLKGFSQMKKKFSVSQKQGIIKPIEKKGKDKR